MILIVASKKDIASLNIAEQILSNYNFRETAETFQESPVYFREVNEKVVKLVTLKDEAVYAQNITGFMENLELVIFISRHSSISGTPTLSVHTPGNLDQAQLGGIPKKVSVSPANAMRYALMTMMHFKEKRNLDYEVSYECTHHGPSLDVPTMFVELGSSPKQWRDLRAAEVVAHAAIKATSMFDHFPAEAVLGIGGPHYNKKFTRIALEEDKAFGHIIPKYAIPSIDLENLRQCTVKTLEKVESAVLDWKGIKGKYKPKLIDMLREINLPFEKV
jgi:D-aminoacyl-tRNA deacylase